jgi:hypothetical protein
MTDEAGPKYYQVDIAMPEDLSPDLNDRPGSNGRDQNPAWQNISDRDWNQPPPIASSGPGWATITMVQDFNTFLIFQDLPTKRMVEIKTTRDDHIEDIRKLPGVTVTETKPSGMYLVGAVYMNMNDIKERHRLIEQGGRDADEQFTKTLQDHFDAVVHPNLKKQIRAAVAQHDTFATLLQVDNETAQAFFLKTRSEPLVDALLAMDYVMLNEMPPSTTNEQFLTPYHAWQKNPAITAVGPTPAP